MSSVARQRVAIAGLLGAAASASVAAASPSNPAFLGISFGPNPGIGARIGTVTPGSPAARAGLQPDDIIVAVDGAIVDVTTLNQYIVAHQPGDAIRIDLLRNNVQVHVAPVLSTRADLFDRLLGHPFSVGDLEDSETGRALDLGKPTGHATVVAWYGTGAGGTQCIDPVPVVRDVARHVSTARVLAATYRTEALGAQNGYAATQKRLGLPLALTSKEAFSSVAIDECGRVFAMVIDCHGAVTFVTPISDGDDEDAALDELAAAAAQADHKRR